MSKANSSHQMGYDTPASWSPARNENTTIRHDIEVIPKALENFVVAISQHNQTAQHLKNVEADYKDMLPKYTDFPSLGTQKTTRLNLARENFDITQARTHEATSMLLEALKGHFPGQVDPASHQDCVSRSELSAIKEQFRTESHELEQLRAENREMKRRLVRLEDHCNREVKSARRSEDRIFKLEDISRTTTNAVESATKKYKSFFDQTSKDRLSYRERFSTLEVEMDKNKTRRKEIDQAIDSIRSSLDNHVGKSKVTHQEQAQNIDLCKSRVEEMQQKLDVEVESNFRDNLEILTAMRKDMKELKEHPAFSSRLPVLCSPAAPTSISIDPVEVETRLKAVEQRVQILDERASEKDMIFADEIDKLRSKLHNLQVELSKVQDKDRDEIPGKKGLTEEELKNFTAWKDLKSRVEGLASNVDDLSANTTRIKDLTSSTKSELQAAISEVKQVTLQGHPESLKPQLEYLSKTVENHIDLLQRHEIRLNSVTTDELCKMMENQWRMMYGVPAELRGLIQRQANLESVTMRSCDDLNKKVSEMNMKYEGMAMEFRNLVKRTVG
ncbi:hypothetical protein KCU69_g11973, partial [Aureobasidium melanogenum]